MSMTMSSNNELVREAILRIPQLVAEGERLLAVLRAAPGQELQPSTIEQNGSSSNNPQAVAAADLVPGHQSHHSTSTDSLRTQFPGYQNGNR